MLDIDKTRTTSYHPQSDGMVERMNRTFKDMLSTYVSANQKDWDEHLQLVCMAYRSAEHESTGYSPNFMLFGRENVLPKELIAGVPPCNRHSDDYIADLEDRLNTVH